MSPRIVVFDLGKVLVDFDYRIAARNLAALSKVPAPHMQEIIEKSRLLVEFETGLTNRDQFFRNVCEATGYCGDQSKFNVLFADIFTAIEPMIEFHAGLRKSGIPTYIFSNTNDLAVTHIRSRFPFFSNFDGYVYSYEHGAMKPQRKIYEVVERTTRMSGPEICYIDDRLENAEAGKAMGWQTIWHKSPEDTIATYRSLSGARAK
ncbi:MAG TPA: HAD family phosphatase [Candidatus Binatia bacterium]|nr:HAD family phosphatase [Candidatus Binatia bacterium]